MTSNATPSPASPSGSPVAVDAAPAKKFACPICEARSYLADAISLEVKAAAQIYHLANHWRTAHETRELSNFQAEDRTAASIAQYEADTAKEAHWYAEYEQAIVAHAAARLLSAEWREKYHARLNAYTATRKAKDCAC